MTNTTSNQQLENHHFYSIFVISLISLLSMGARCGTIDRSGCIVDNNLALSSIIDQQKASCGESIEIGPNWSEDNIDVNALRAPDTENEYWNFRASPTVENTTIRQITSNNASFWEIETTTFPNLQNISLNQQYVVVLNHHTTHPKRITPTNLSVHLRNGDNTLEKHRESSFTHSFCSEQQDPITDRLLNLPSVQIADIDDFSQITITGSDPTLADPDQKILFDLQLFGTHSLADPDFTQIILDERTVIFMFSTSDQVFPTHIFASWVQKNPSMQIIHLFFRNPENIDLYKGILEQNGFSGDFLVSFIDDQGNQQQKMIIKNSELSEGDCPIYTHFNDSYIR